MKLLFVSNDGVKLEIGNFLLPVEFLDEGHGLLTELGNFRRKSDSRE
jgi:hypothetical protein